MRCGCAADARENVEGNARASLGGDELTGKE